MNNVNLANSRVHTTWDTKKKWLLAVGMTSSSFLDQRGVVPSLQNQIYNILILQLIFITITFKKNKYILI